MYQYNQLDKQFVQERVSLYRDQTDRYLAGQLTENEFQQLRLRNGLYIQRLAPMLRVAIPYGTLDSKQLRRLASISRKYDKGYGHLTTRQNIQFNWPTLISVPDILQELAEVDMHAIQTSGSCIRNITTDEFAGAAGDEAIDPRPYCELIRQWSTAHPEFDWLPRKFKIAITGAVSDRAATAVHDIGIQVHKDAGQTVCDFSVGGGLGRTPVVAALIKTGLPVSQLISYLESIMRVYNRFGRRDNKYKARIKILVRAMTPDKFRDEVEEEWREVKKHGAENNTLNLEKLTRAFKLPDLVEENFEPPSIEWKEEDSEFGKWLANNTSKHKVGGYTVVTLSTKVIGMPPGDVSAEQMEAVATWADQYSVGEIRVSHDQNLVLPHVKNSELKGLWIDSKSFQLGTANIGLMSDIICCPGGDFCSLANAKSIPIAESIQRQFSEYDEKYNIGKLDINISGCMNACGHHHVGNIGILGVDKKGEEFFQISLGGHSGHSEIPAALGSIVGPSVYRDEVTSVIEKILHVFINNRVSDEPFIRCFQRIGMEPFRKYIYEPTT